MTEPKQEADAAADHGDEPELAAPFSEQDVADIEERSRLRAPMIYEIVRREGEEEMDRPTLSLWWSGLAAGLSISFSLFTQAALTLDLPDAPWRPLVADFGYSVGFLIVVLARQQLFTENTITVVLPVAAEPTLRNFARLSRMWSIVLAANVAGALFAALFCSFTPVLSPDLKAAMIEVSRRAMEPDALQMFFRAIAAGFLIATMVWLTPSAENAQFWVVTLMTYLVALGGFAHIVAGSVEASMLIVNGQASAGDLVLRFGIPVLFGNIVGGTALFALISYAQVAKEV